MTGEQAVFSWGLPKNAIVTKANDGTTEQWIYGIGRYLTVKKGKVTAIQN